MNMSKKLRPELWEEGPDGPNGLDGADGADGSDGAYGPVLLGVACPECGQKHFPPRQACPNCYCDTLVPSKLPGWGTIYCSTKVWIPSPKIKEHPYHIGYVNLDEGITVPAVFTGADEYSIGTRVQLVVDVLRTEGEEDIFFYKFRPVPPGGESR